MSGWTRACLNLRRYAADRQADEQYSALDPTGMSSVVPDSDRTLRSKWMLAASRERLGVEPTVVPGGHCPHVSRPRDLAHVLGAP